MLDHQECGPARKQGTERVLAEQRGRVQELP